MRPITDVSTETCCEASRHISREWARSLISYLSDPSQGSDCIEQQRLLAPKDVPEVDLSFGYLLLTFYMLYGHELINEGSVILST